MSLPFHLGLRDNRHLVSLMRLEGRSREVLGVAYPQDADRRLRILEQWGIDARSPRAESLGTINMPLSPRDQTILSYQLDADRQSALNGGVTTLIQSRRAAQAGVKERIHLGAAHAALPVRSHGGPAPTDTHGQSATSATRAQHGIGMTLRIR